MIENEYPIPSYFPVTVEAFMKGDQEAIERGNQVFLPWQHADKASGQEKGSSLPEGWKETKRADKAPEEWKPEPRQCGQPTGCHRRGSVP